MDIQSARLTQIEPSFPSHPDVPPAEEKSMEELRGVARQFAITNSLRLVELESVLFYEESCKSDICFFQWIYNTKDWSNTEWAMMPPFLQVGVLKNGNVIIYINTLDFLDS